MFKGLYDKYEVCKRNGETDSDARYFVLRLDTDPHARKAVAIYAESIRGENPLLASDLDALLVEVFLLDDAIRNSLSATKGM